MTSFIKIAFIFLLFQSCTTSNDKISSNFLCDGDEYCCKKKKEYSSYLTAFKFSTPKASFQIDDKTYYEYSLGSDRNYSASFLCIENQYQEIVYYRGMTHYCSFYKNSEEGKEVKAYLLARIAAPIKITEEEIREEIEDVYEEIEIKEQ
ncbi:hypothetical protein ACE193_02460 [Bernardetia sp. OM2101]|uniref:hypothetical protein n=1 Tax=Bernardetia sp. OM2101 TaxID=3344876 RepID=UPI0035CFC117